MLAVRFGRSCFVRRSAALALATGLLACQQDPPTPRSTKVSLPWEHAATDTALGALAETTDADGLRVGGSCGRQRLTGILSVLRPELANCWRWAGPRESGTLRYHVEINPLGRVSRVSVETHGTPVPVVAACQQQRIEVLLVPRAEQACSLELASALPSKP